MLNKVVWAALVLNLGSGIKGKGEEADRSFVPQDGFIFSAGVFGPA